MCYYVSLFGLRHDAHVSKVFLPERYIYWMLMCTATPAAPAAYLLLSALGNRWASTESMEEINLNACEMQGKSYARAASAAAQEDERERENSPISDLFRLSMQGFAQQFPAAESEHRNRRSAECPQKKKKKKSPEFWGLFCLNGIERRRRREEKIANAFGLDPSLFE